MTRARMGMRCWGSSAPHSAYRRRLAARWAAPSVPQVSLLLSPHVLGRQQACRRHVKQHDGRKPAWVCNISRDFYIYKVQSCEPGYLPNFVKVSCHPLCRHHGLEGGPDSWRDRGAAGACSPGDRHQERGLHGELYPTESSFNQQAAQQVLDGFYRRNPSQGGSWQSTMAHGQPVTCAQNSWSII